MALVHQPVFPQTPKSGVVSFVNADGTTKKTLLTAGTEGTKLVSVTATSTDSSARVCQLWLTRSATSYLICALSIPANSGSDGTTAAVNIVNSTILPGLPVDNVSQRFIYLQSGDTLQASFTAAVTATKEIDLLAVATNF